MPQVGARRGGIEWRLAKSTLVCHERPLLMGIINVTPDSFSDGGLYADPGAAITHGLQLAELGADLLDVGGESTRPGAAPIDAAEELRRVLPVVTALARQSRVPVSVDTSKASVARAVLDAGAQVINDVTALAGDSLMASSVAGGTGIILMHMKGTPATMQLDPRYHDVVAEIDDFFQARLQAAEDAGIERERIVLDPGIGFGKTHEHNMQVLGHLARYQRHGRPVCLGVSRKGTIGKIVGSEGLAERIIGSVAAACFAWVRGTAQIFRVHDVKETRAGLAVCQEIMSREE
jgi:dihydropteroate synthase